MLSFEDETEETKDAFPRSIEGLRFLPFDTRDFESLEIEILCLFDNSGRDGDQSNPEGASFEMLLKARGNAYYTIHLTYSIIEIDDGRKKDWLKVQNKEKKGKNLEKNVREVVNG